jgi:hypothetical protein
MSKSTEPQLHMYVSIYYASANSIFLSYLKCLSLCSCYNEDKLEGTKGAIQGRNIDIASKSIFIKIASFCIFAKIIKI